MFFAYLYAKIIRKLRGKAILNSDIHSTAVVNSGSQVVNSQLGRYSYCGCDCEINHTDIGSFCSISHRVFIGGAEHPIDWVSTSPVFENTKHSGPVKRFSKFDVPAIKRTVIGSDVWIGYGATIKQGVHIGHGAVIGSNALVTKDVPPYAVVGGVPAKLIKYRFDEETIVALLKSEWWKWSDEKITEMALYIKEPRKFLDENEPKVIL